MRSDCPEKLVAVTGIGQTPARRPSDRSALALTVQAAREAIRDAGLSPGDIRAVSTYPGLREDPTGLSPVTCLDIRQALGLELDWYGSSNQDSPSQLSIVFNAINAIAAGVVDHVLVVRTVMQATARAGAKSNLFANRAQSAAYGMWQWMSPYGAVSAAPWYALYAQRHFHEYGTTPEQLGQIAVNGRAWAQGNPHAIYREPITIADYLASREVASPLRLFDCDVPIDGSTAIVLSRLSVAKTLRNPVLRFEATGHGLGHNSLVSPTDFTSFGAEAASEQLWRKTDLRPRDIRVAELYDGFSIITMLWLEALGFCEKGQGGAFVDRGVNIGKNGMLPLNTGGGQLSGGRYHGLGHLHEACVQLWNRGGDRQVAGEPRTAVVSNGVLGHGCAILVRD